jgi:hypothetical protein
LREVAELCYQCAVPIHFKTIKIIMSKTMLRLGVLSLLALAVAAAPTFSIAQEKKKGDGKRLPPINGKVAAIDKTAKTLTVGEHTFTVTSETRISKDGKPATLDDGAVGEEVTVMYSKTDDGKYNARMVRFGPRPEGEGKKKKKE